MQSSPLDGFNLLLPAIEEGFYYDFELTEPLSSDDLSAIEERMRELMAADLPFVREEVTRAEALVKPLVNAHVGCDDFALQDRDLLSTTPQLAAGLPAAYGRCSIGDDANVDIAHSAGWRASNGCSVGVHPDRQSRG